MTPQKLKNSILQLAIQGKLVEQRAEEGTAEELYREIQKEKAALLKSGRIKKEKSLPEIAEDEKPLDIPESWMWVRLGSIFQLINGDRGQNYPSKDKLSSAGDIPFISAINMDNQTVRTDNLLFVSTKQYNALGSGKLQENDFVFCLRGSLGKFCKYPYSIGAIASSLVILRKYGNTNDDYITSYLESPLIASQINESNNGTAQPNLGARDIAKYLIPLPPLAEQKRIVAKIEELLPLIDRYEKAWSKLEDFNKRFPTDMQKSLLQMAIEGKLVEQRPEEGTGEELYREIQAEKQKLIKEGKIKKDKPLPEIADDEKPFDIPDSWKWVRIGSVTYNFGQKTPNNQFCYIDVGSIDNKNHQLNTTETIVEASDASSRARKIVSFGDVIFATIRPYLQNVCIIDREFSFEAIVSTAFAVMSCPQGLLNKYLFYALLSPSFMEYANATDKAKGVAYPAIGEKDFFNGVIPLPPLAEQKRIVAKLEELLPLCEKLK